LFGRLLGLLATSPFTSRRILWFIARVRSDDLVTLQEMVEAGKITAAIDREYALHEVPDAIRYLKSGQGRAKVVIGTFLP
jgi:D-arabinose 1-dehydrogenase-like Zn-dependent alcohol dehydrogenase